MDDHLTCSRASIRTICRYAATVLVVALSSAGCSVSERAPTDLVGMRSVAHLPPEVDHGVPLSLDEPTFDRLDPDLLAAVRAAARDARHDGVRMSVTSGWRSRAHQQRLFDEAVREYGSEEEARRYVATPDRSAHVTGDAVDLGPRAADSWLGRHGAAYGLCQIFANEVWHYELATTPGGRCPDLLPDGSSRN